MARHRACQCRLAGPSSDAHTLGPLFPDDLAMHTHLATPFLRGSAHAAHGRCTASALANGPLCGRRSGSTHTSDPRRLTLAGAAPNRAKHSRTFCRPPTPGVDSGLVPVGTAPVADSRPTARRPRQIPRHSPTPAP